MIAIPTDSTGTRSLFGTFPRICRKLTDVIGLYLNPPDQGIVLLCGREEPNSGSARTQPVLPLKKGRCGTMTHDYKRHGTTTLFAALDVLAGKVIVTAISVTATRSF